ncbi:hypothetical protein HanRHA438_Chr06g0286571 [Helianthus annuus]|nr:hypothetical protein HanRHA438_Chr06g0286571 [Helianthus annuus]
MIINHLAVKKLMHLVKFCVISFVCVMIIIYHLFIILVSLRNIRVPYLNGWRTKRAVHYFPITPCSTYIIHRTIVFTVFFPKTYASKMFKLAC